LKGLAFGAVGSVASTGFAERQAYSLKVERLTLSLPEWDACGFRVALIADPHVNFVEPTKRAREAAILAMKEKPDAILVLGDFVNHSFWDVYNNIGRAFDVLNDAPCPCFGVLGNHDYRVDAVKLAEAIKRTRIVLLRNEVVDVDGVSIFGIDDALFGQCRPDKLRDYPHSRSLIAMLHEPDYVDTVTPAECSIQVSGHSHGGQMCMPFGKPLSLPVGARKHFCGFYPDAKVPVYVSRGVGTIGVDLRFFCPPEVTILTLRQG